MAAIVARQSERSRLARVIEDAAEATVRTAVVEGEAGIGKSTLLAETAILATRRNFLVVRARAEELEHARPFGPLAAAFRQLGETEGAAVLAGVLRSGEGFSAVDALVDWVESRAVRRPVLLMVDDMQWADGWTWRAVAILARRLEALPVAIVVAMRPSAHEDSAAAAVRAIAADGVYLRLGALSEADVAALIEARSGASPSARLLAYMARAGGNPFFVNELFDALDREGGIARSGSELDVVSVDTPPSLLLTVLRRLSSYSSEELELLRAAAVLGGSFTASDLALATGAADAVVPTLVALRRDGVVLDDADGGLRLRHDVIREAIYEDLGAGIRTSMHQRIGRALADAGRVVNAAYHLTRAELVRDQSAADILVAAASEPGVDLRDSARFIETALRLAPDHPDARSLQVRAGRAMVHSDRPAAGVEILTAVLDSTDDAAERLALVGNIAVGALLAGDLEEQRRRLAEAAALADELRDSDDPVVLRSVAQTRFHADDTEGALAVARRAVEIARSRADTAIEEEAQNMCVWLLTEAGRPAEAVPLSARVMELCSGRPSEAMRRNHLAVALAELGDMNGAATQLDAAARVADEHGPVWVHLKVLVERAWIDLRRADWDSAALAADAALAIMRQYDLHPPEGAHPGLVDPWIRYHRDEDGVLEALDCVPGSGRAVSMHARWLRTKLAYDAGAFDSGLELASQTVESPDRTSRYRGGPLPDAVRVAVAAGSQDVAARVCSLAETDAAGRTAPGWRLVALRCRARANEDSGAAAEALAVADEVGWPLERAAAFEDVAAVLPERRSELFEAAAAVYESVGADRDLRRVQAALGQRVRAKRAPRPTVGWEALTAAEREVVALAAEGLTNRQIGERLFVGHRTVATHLTHAFDKLGVRSRVALAREAARRTIA